MIIFAHYLLSFCVMGVDQWTKYLARVYLTPYEPWVVMPGFNYTLAFNSGSAFSFLAHSGPWHRIFFIVFALLLVILLAVWLARSRVPWLERLGLALIMGGAASNLIDRLHLGHVVDFIDIYVGSYHWPVFNLADSAICLGAFCWLLHGYNSRAPGNNSSSGINTKGRDAISG